MTPTNKGFQREFIRINFYDSGLSKDMIQDGLVKKGLRCPIDRSDKEVFFSLVDYRNNLFTSKDPHKIIEFYNSFDSTVDLVEWMKERPKGVPWIREVDGQKDIIVVILTADFNGKYARECRENIFKGLHIIFVESGGRGDFYFNIAHYINVGIKRAMEYNPKWIVFSNDDMYKIDDIEVLKNELSKIDFKAFDVVFTNPSKYHSIPDNLGKENMLRKIGFTFFPRRRMQKKIEKKFNVTLFPAPVHSYFRFFYKPGYRYISLADFGIFSSNFIEDTNGQLYNENFADSGEDNDLSFRVSLRRNRYTFINYNIGDFQGKTLGTDTSRRLKMLSSLILLNYMIDNDLHPASKEIKKYI